MNVDVFGRIRRPVRREDSAVRFQVDGHNRISSSQGGNNFSFQSLFRQTDSNEEVFRSCVQQLLDMFLEGFNVCMIILGESSSGKNYTMAGDAEKPGLVPIILDRMFAKLKDYDRHGYRDESLNPTVHLQMYEIYNELIQDLFRVSQSVGFEPLQISESVEKGVCVQDGSVIQVGDTNEADRLFLQGWDRRTTSNTDRGPAQSYTSTILYLDLVRPMEMSPLPERSRFTIVRLSGMEKLGDEDLIALRFRDGPKLNKSLLSFNILVNTLATQPYPDRVVNYRESSLTRLLADQVGGNCRTRALACLKPDSEPHVVSAVVKTCTELSQVKNFPIQNDGIAQALITQYKARIFSLENDGAVGPGLDSSSLGLRDEMRRIQGENIQLRDKNERLQSRLDSMQGKFGHLATSKTDISHQLLSAEEEKLKVSKALVEMQIENNKVKEEMEAAKFELTNKILMLENDVMELEIERDRHAKVARSAKTNLEETERDRKDIADEYVTLKANYAEMSREHDQQIARNEELSLELVNLINSQSARARVDPESDRVRAMVSRLSNRRVRPEEIIATEKERVNMEKRLFGKERKYQDEMERMQHDHNDEQDKVGSKMSNLKKDLQEGRNLARERQQKIAQAQAKLITTESELERLQSENNHLQHKLKDVNGEYRSRLMKYVQDISEFVDHGSGIPDQIRTEDRMRDYVDNMLKDIKRAHKAREEQLSQAAQSYRSKSQDVVKKHEQLLVAYRQRGASSDDQPYLDERQFKMSDSDLHSANQREVFRLKDEVESLQQQFESGRLNGHQRNARGGEQQENWSDVRRQIRAYSQNAQQELEKERAQLMSEREVLREEVKELKEYIDNHLIRYKQEIVRLRKMLGIEEDGQTGTLRN